MNTQEKTYTKGEIVSRINNASKNGTLVLKVNGFETSESIFMRAVKEKGNKVSFDTKKCVFDGTVYSIDIEFSALTKDTEQAPENTSRTPAMKVAIAVKKEGLTTTKAIAEHTGLTEKEVCECLDKLPYEYWDKVTPEPEASKTFTKEELIETLESVKFEKHDHKAIRVVIYIIDILESRFGSNSMLERFNKKGFKQALIESLKREIVNPPSFTFKLPEELKEQAFSIIRAYEYGIESSGKKANEAEQEFEDTLIEMSDEELKKNIGIAYNDMVENGDTKDISELIHFLVQYIEEYCEYPQYYEDTTVSMYYK